MIKALLTLEGHVSLISQKINYLNNYFKIAFLNIRSNLAGNFFAFLIMSFSFFVMLIFTLCYINVYNYMLSFEKNNTMLIFLKDSANYHNNNIIVNDLLKNIKKLHGVKSIKYYSYNSSLRFLIKHTPKISPVLKTIDPRDLPPVIKIHFNPEYISRIYLSNVYFRVKSLNGVRFVYYSRLLADKIGEFIFFTKVIGLLIFLFLFISSIFISYSAIKLIILKKQDEIEILKLVGATNSYIRIPMFIEGVIGAVLSFITSIILLFLLFKIFIYYHFNGFLSYFKIEVVFLNAFEIFVIFLIAVLSGFLGTYFSSRKFF